MGVQYYATHDVGDDGKVNYPVVNELLLQIIQGEFG